MVYLKYGSTRAELITVRSILPILLSFVLPF